MGIEIKYYDPPVPFMNHTLLGYVHSKISQRKFLKIYCLLNRDGFWSDNRIVDMLINLDHDNESSTENDSPWYILLRTRKKGFPVLIRHKDTTYVILDESEDCEVEFDLCQYVLDRIKRDPYWKPKY